LQNNLIVCIASNSQGYLLQHTLLRSCHWVVPTNIYLLHCITSFSLFCRVRTWEYSDRLTICQRGTVPWTMLMGWEDCSATSRTANTILWRGWRRLYTRAFRLFLLELAWSR